MFVECNEASRFLQNIFQGDAYAIAKIVTAEAEDDFVTLKEILAEVAKYSNKLIKDLNNAQKKAMGRI